MSLGATLGVPGGRGLNGNMMVEPSLRVLALVTDAFGGHGGIAQYNRDLLSSLVRCERIGEVLVLPRGAVTSPGMLPSGIRQFSPVAGRRAYSLTAMGAIPRCWPIDIVFCGHIFMAPLAAIVARLSGARLWIQVHGIDAWQELPWFYRRAIEGADLITSVSRHTRRRLLAWVGIDPAHVKVLPNTVDPRFQPGPKPDYLLDRHALYEKKILLTVSRLASSERYKGHDRVIRVLPRILLDHPDTIYLVVGDGDDRPRLEALTLECGVQDKVIFTGPVVAEELPDYYRLADLMVMPSTGEGFGIVFLEAMASGVPVIGGTQDGSLDPLSDGALGTAVDPDDDQALASAISAALRRPVRNANVATRFTKQSFGDHLQALVRSSVVSAR